MSRRLSFGMRVIARESPDFTFQSRIVGWDDQLNKPIILIPFEFQNQYWAPKAPWSKNHLRPAEGNDWVANSSFKRNDVVNVFNRYDWSIDLNRYFSVIIQEPYFNTGNWLVKFSLTAHVVMYALVNEKDFK